MNQRVRSALASAVLLIIVVFTAWSVGSMFLYSGSGNMRVHRGVIFRYFTVDSNILCALSCAFALPARLFGRGKGAGAAMLLRYMGTASVTVTMLTVLFFLGILYGYPAMFEGWNLWLHGIGPLLSIVSFVWLERDGTAPEKKHLVLSLLPVIVYGGVYLVMAVVIGAAKGGWPDFYGFNMSGRWYLSYAGMLAGTALIGAALRMLRKAGRRPRAR